MSMESSRAIMDSVVHLLRSVQRETDCEKALRMNCRIARSLVLQETMDFLPVWKRKSNKHVCIGLDRRMYFDNHQLCFFNDGAKGRPCLLYDFGAIQNAMKTVAVLLYHGHTRRSSASPEEKEVCFLVLSADGYLRVFNADNGVLLKSIFLSTAIKYRYLHWANYLHTVQVKSVQSSRRSSRQRGVAQENTPTSSRLLVIAVFKILPLELVACLAVDRQVFGKDIQDATLNQDMLVVSHSKGLHRIYSLPWIMEHCTIVKATIGEYVQLDDVRAGVVGEPGFGVPLTVHITEPPPLLFEARSGPELGVSFGGSPTVYLHNPSPSETSVFLLHSLHTGEQVARFSTDTVAFHQDVAEFHHDDYQRIVHISGSTVSCYQLVDRNIVKQYTTDFRAQATKNYMPTRTLSGRTIRRRVSTRELDDLYVSAVQDLDYENELDLLYAVVTLPSDGGEGTQAWLYFIDDRNGQILKAVSLPTWKPDANNSVYYELDCILHLVQEAGASTCHYYRLSRTHTRDS